MTYMQIKAGQKLHLVYEAGEGPPGGELVRRGYLSHPICGRKASGFRMTINVPLAHVCHNCWRVLQSRGAS